MKKLIATTAILLGLSMTTFAQGGLFHRGDAVENTSAEYSLTKGGSPDTEASPMLPNHDATGGNQPAPVGSGLAILAGLGAAYLVGKKRK
jgi:hypothetical protein